MKIKELMALDLFKKSKLLTGDIGLENEVSSAMVLEAIDIEKWSKRNQLILTSFYAFQNVPEKEWDNFFEKTKEIGISGLVIKMDRLITMIPESLIDLCFQYEIPLIKIMADISYEKIMLTIYEPIIYAQGHLLRVYYNVRQRFAELGRNLQSFEQILDVVYQLIEAPCYFEIPGSNVSIHRGRRFENYVVTQSNYLKTNEFTKNSYERLLLLSPDHSQELVAYKTTIMTRTNDYCTLMVYQQHQEIRESHILILENAIDVIHEHLQLQYQIKKDRHTRLNNLADAILQNTPSNMDELNSLLDDANMNSYPYYQGVAFTRHKGDQVPLDKLMVKKISSLRKNTLFFEHYNYTIILYNLKERKSILTKKKLQQLFTTEIPLSKGVTISLSQIKEKNQLKRIMFECLNSLRFNNKLHIGPIISFKDLGIFQYFMEDEHFERLEVLIPEELKLLQLNHYDFFETLYTFFKCGRNYKRTAELLFLHPKTVRYRLKRIEEILNIDLSNPIQLVNYEISTHLLKIKTKRENTL